MQAIWMQAIDWMCMRTDFFIFCQGILSRSLESAVYLWTSELAPNLAFSHEVARFFGTLAREPVVRHQKSEIEPGEP